MLCKELSTLRMHVGSKSEMVKRRSISPPPTEPAGAEPIFFVEGLWVLPERGRSSKIVSSLSETWDRLGRGMDYGFWILRYGNSKGKKSRGDYTMLVGAGSGANKSFCKGRSDLLWSMNLKRWNPEPQLS